MRIAAHRGLRRLRPSIDRRSWPVAARSAVTMGNESSLPLDMCATFDAEEIKRLGKRCE